MAKGNQASFAKRQREAAKRVKQQEKQLKRAARRVGETDEAGALDENGEPLEVMSPESLETDGAVPAEVPAAAPAAHSAPASGTP